MNRILLSAAATCLLLLPLACDLGKTGNQLLATKVMVGTLVSTPDVYVSGIALLGGDAGTLPDGGIPEGERVPIPGQTAALVYFVNRESEGGIPEPISNATVRIEAQGGAAVDLKSDGLGSYSKTTDFADSSGVRYQSGANYRFIATQGGVTHVGLVEAAPAQERIDALHPTSGYVRHPRNQALTLKRPDVPVGKERTLGFVTVIPVNNKGDKGAPTYSSFPSDPLSLLGLVATPFEYQKQTLEVPGTAFPSVDSNYLVIFQTMKTGGPESDNLFLGSPMLVGTADVGLVRTQP